MCQRQLVKVGQDHAIYGECTVMLLKATLICYSRIGVLKVRLVRREGQTLRKEELVAKDFADWLKDVKRMMEAVPNVAIKE